MKIDRIQKIKGYRIFRDFAWPATGLLDFAQFNLIYGWNGAGKTSLSNVFHALQKRSPLSEGSVELTVGKQVVVNAGFAGTNLPAIRTFNRDSIDRSVFESPNQQLPPVFYLGEDTVEKQRQVEELQRDLTAVAATEAGLEVKIGAARASYESFCAEEAKGTKNLLTAAGGGPFNNYNAGNFKTDVQALSVLSTRPTALAAKQRASLLATKDERSMPTADEPAVQFPDVGDLALRAQKMLKRSVVSDALDELANPEISAWVATGLRLHSGEHESATCRFCSQELLAYRRGMLEAHFNDEFKRFVAEIGGLIAEVSRAGDFMESLSAPPKEALYAGLRTAYEAAMNTLKQHAGTAKYSMEIIQRALQAKRAEPFAELSLDHFITNFTASGGTAGGFEVFLRWVLGGAWVLGAWAGKVAFDQMVNLIKQHNQQTASFDASLKAARTSLAQDETLRALPEWEIKQAELAQLQKHAVEAKQKMVSLRSKITGLESEIRQHRQPADELNKEIASYLGRDELKFVPEKSGYRIMRGSQPAMHLSDGERTAIAFLYFLKSLKGADFDLEKGIVVIDDPISSLDSNSMFSAFGFLKERTAKAGQLFVLTHNFTFFRQVRNWYYNLPGQGKKDPNLQPARFYMLASHFADGARSSRLEPLDPFLHQYESEYHYLFKRIYEEANRLTPLGLEAYYAIPNVARRLLEAFLAFKVPDKPGELYKKLEAVSYDQAKKIRILRFLHTYSHLDQISEGDNDMAILSETPAVLQDVLDFIRHFDKAHFDSMVHLVALPAPPASPPAAAATPVPAAP